MESFSRSPDITQFVISTNCLYGNYTLSSNKQRNPLDTDGIRGDLALQLFHQTTSLGIRMIVCDGGSSPDFLSEIERFKERGLTLVTSKTSGRGPQRRRAFEMAAQLSHNTVNLYTQAEKVGLITKDSLTLIAKAISSGTQIVILARNPKLFEQSYPPYMRESELWVNRTYDRLMQQAKLTKKGDNFDWFFGPFAFVNEPKIVSLFLKQYQVIEDRVRIRYNRVYPFNPNPEMYSDGHYFPLIEALANKIPVSSVEVPFVYPSMQRENEMIAENLATCFRRRKTDGNVYRYEAIHLLGYLKANPNSSIKEVIGNIR